MPRTPPVPPAPGSLGTNWRGRDKAAAQNARTARQNARTARQQQPPAGTKGPKPGQPPTGMPSDPLTTGIPPGGPPTGMPSDPLTAGAGSYVNWGGQQGGGMDEMLMSLLSGGPMGGMPPELQYGGYGGPTGGPGGIGGGGIDDPIELYKSTVPVMDMMMRDRVSGAMGQAGLGGGRFSSAAQRSAGKIGGDTALQQNQMLNDLLYRHTQEDLNRGLQASTAALGFGSQDLDRGVGAAQSLGQLGLGMDQSQQQKLAGLGQAGQWEQDRQDQFQMQRYLDFINSRKGWVPELLNFAGGNNQAPQQPQGYPTTTAGSPGLMDFLPLLLPLLTGGG